MKCVGSKMVIHHHTTEGTALHPSTFRLRYEFVDTRLGGDSWSGGGLLKLDSIAAMSTSQVFGTPPTTTSGRPVISPCARVFRKIREADVSSPRYLYGFGVAHLLRALFTYLVKRLRNVFLYGRGGAANLTCAYRIEAGPGERVRLTIKNVSLGASCITEPDSHTGRPKCNQIPGSRTVSLRIWESPWKDIRVSLFSNS